MSSHPAIIPGRADRILLLGVARSGTRWLATALGNTEHSRLVKEPDRVDADPAGSGRSQLGLCACDLKLEILWIKPCDRIARANSIADIDDAGRDLAGDAEA